MTRLRSLVNRLLGLVRSRRLDRELDDEVVAHLEMAERDALASGMAPSEARRAARLAFGSIDGMKEAHRDHRSVRWLETLLNDVRYGLVALSRDRLFTIVAVGVLALGVGANAAMFSLVDAVLLRPLPFPSPDRIVRVWEAPRPGVTNSTSTFDFRDWQRLATSFEVLAAEQSIAAALTGAGDPVRLDGKAVTSDYFTVFGTPLALGRAFLPADAQSAPVVILSHAAWQTYLGGASDALERRLLLDGEAHQVIGVLAPGPFDRDRAAFWKPLTFPPDLETREWHWLTVYGRLRPAVTLDQAREEMRAIDAALEDVTPLFKRPWTIEVQALEELVVSTELRRSIVVAFGAVILVLLIACANVTNLLLARGSARGRELAIRGALGASRGRLVAQLLTESATLCLLGAAAGGALAALLIEMARPLLSEALPYTADVRVNLRVLAFAGLVASVITLLIGILPSSRASSVDCVVALNQSARGSSDSRTGLRRAIVAIEVALSLVLVCGALLLLRSLLNLHQLETGVRIESIMTLSVDLPRHAYPTVDRAALATEALARRIEAAPAVARVALTTHLPLQWIGDGEGLHVPGFDEPINVRFKRVDPGYFPTLDMPVLAGRGITAHDRRGAPFVLVVNETLARRVRDLMKAPDVVGMRVTLQYPEYLGGVSRQDMEIVGIVRNERVNAPGRPDPAVAYVPLTQAPHPGLKILVRTHAAPVSVLPAIREAVREVDPHLPVGEVATLEQVHDRTLSGTSRPAWLIGIFAGAATLLAALGLYGVLAQAITQQRREIGIRMALGANARVVVAQVLRGAMAMILLGMALGVIGAAALAQVLQGLLFDVSALDPLAFTAACVCTLVVGVSAALIPATRAARVQPITVLRDEG